MDEHPLARRAAAEAVGTALLIFVGAGSIAALLLLDPGKPFNGPDLGLVALAFGFTVAALIYVIGPISGSHVNPAVTVGLAATRRFPWHDVPAYVTAQMGGAAVGALLMWGVFGSRGTQLGAGFGMATFDGSTVNWGSAFLAEALATAILLFVVLGAIDHHAPQAVAGLIIGLALAAIVLVDRARSRAAAMNPARVFGPLFVQTVDGSGVHNWLQFVAVYIPAELARRAVAASLSATSCSGERATARPAPSSATAGVSSAASAGCELLWTRGPMTTETFGSPEKPRERERRHVAAAPRAPRARRRRRRRGGARTGRRAASSASLPAALVAAVLPRQPAAAQRAERLEPDAALGAERENVPLDLTIEERVRVLDGGDGPAARPA